MISVIMTTDNGAATLPLTLEALKGLSPAGQAVEMIAVDNASSDGTPAILEDYQGALPLIALSEPRRGKSFALSRALDAAHGELIVFTDDDVLAEPQWLQAYEAAAGRLPDVGPLCRAGAPSLGEAATAMAAAPRQGGALLWRHAC